MSKISYRIEVDSLMSHVTSNDEAKWVHQFLPPSTTYNVAYVGNSISQGTSIYSCIYDIPNWIDDGELKVHYRNQAVDDGQYTHIFKLIDRLEFQFNSQKHAAGYAAQSPYSSAPSPHYTVPSVPTAHGYYGLTGVPAPQKDSCDHEYVNSQCKKCKAVWV
jgi:hypothetical protein